jgi:hypothetical protein
MKNIQAANENTIEELKSQINMLNTLMENKKGSDKVEKSNKKKNNNKDFDQGKNKINLNEFYLL